MTKSTALRQNRGGSGSRTRTITTFTTQSTFYCTRNRFAQVCQKIFEVQSFSIKNRKLNPAVTHLPGWREEKRVSRSLLLRMFFSSF